MSDLQVSREIAENRLSYLKGGRKSGPTGDAAAQQLRERVAQLTAKLVGLNEEVQRAASARSGGAHGASGGPGIAQDHGTGQQAPRPGGVVPPKPLEAA